MIEVRSEKRVLVDSGFWFGLCDERDQFHKEAARIFSAIKSARVLFPWPVLYEVLNSKFVKRQPSVVQFDANLKSLKLDYIEDQIYRRSAYQESLVLAIPNKRQISLVDMVIRHMLADVNLRVDYLVTFNDGDFHDVCKKRMIEIIKK